MADPTPISQYVAWAGWIVAAIGSAWIAFKRVQGWDHGEQAWKATHGDNESKDPKERDGLLTRMADAERTLGEYKVLLFGDPLADPEKKPVEYLGFIKAMTYVHSAATTALRRVKWLQEGLGAHGSREDIVVEGVRKSFASRVREEVQKRRAGMMREVEQSFAERGEDSRDPIEARVTPVPRPNRPPQLPPTIPRVDADEPFDGETTQNRRNRGKGTL